ncbi:MAG TPA: DUF3300 domain-containing protein [Syntrophorhabdales bacterium]|nr:DUF3300 domain-containing protein [Syntrophorhabdales bacterium]
MKMPKISHAILVWWLVLWMAAPTCGFAQETAQQPGGAPLFKPEQLEQIVAPIALYPDDLLAQIFMASTYPLEIVQAARWVKANPNLKGDQLTAGLEKQNWDPSVKSLVNFPDVLNMMNDKLDWTQQLGDAVLAQQKDLMAAVQRLRQKAQVAGNLKTTNEQKVIVEPQTQYIVIQPANPQVIYVPTYNPTVVYGVWAYPAYPPPPVYAYPYGAMAFSFAAGVAVGAAWGYAGGSCNWGHGDVNMNVYKNANINNNINRSNYQNKVTTGQGGQGQWKHNPESRKGVAYRDQGTAKKFGQQPRASNDMRRDYGGRDGAGGGRGQGAGGGRDQGIGGGRGQGTGGPQASQQPRNLGGGDRGGAGASRGQAAQQRGNNSAFGGDNRGSEARQASNRGNQSLGSGRQSGGSSGLGGQSRGGSGGGLGGGGRGGGGGGRSGGGGGRGGGRGR